jgi:anti-anti-sigma regulatory factor
MKEAVHVEFLVDLESLEDLHCCVLDSLVDFAAEVKQALEVQLVVFVLE